MQYYRIFFSVSVIQFVKCALRNCEFIEFYAPIVEINWKFINLNFLASSFSPSCCWSCFFFNLVAFLVLLWAAIRRQKCVDNEIQLWQKLNHTKSIRRTLDITIQIINFDDSNERRKNWTNRMTTKTVKCKRFFKCKPKEFGLWIENIFKHRRATKKLSIVIRFQYKHATYTVYQYGIQIWKHREKIYAKLLWIFIYLISIFELNYFRFLRVAMELSVVSSVIDDIHR